MISKEGQAELAKSWFIAAQLCMILAGFLFASAGIILTNSQNTMNFGLDKVGQVTVQDCGSLENVTNYQEVTVGILDYVQETVESNLDVYKDLAQYGSWLIIASVVFFLIGRSELKKL